MCVSPSQSPSLYLRLSPSQQCVPPDANATDVQHTRSLGNWTGGGEKRDEEGDVEAEPIKREREGEGGGEKGQRKSLG